MKRRGFFSKLFIGAAAAPSVVKAAVTKPDVQPEPTHQKSSYDRWNQCPGQVAHLPHIYCNPFNCDARLDVYAGGLIIFQQFLRPGEFVNVQLAEGIRQQDTTTKFTKFHMINQEQAA